MRELVIHQPRQRGAFPAIPFIPLLAAKGPKPGEILAAGANLEKLKGESLMFGAAGNSGTRVVHGAPVENLAGETLRERRNKSKHYFSP